MGPAPLADRRKASGREVTFYTRDYAHIDHGYAATVHKAQGVTVDRAHVLATPHMDRHAAYVGLTRHRDGVELHYAREDFADPARLARVLSRERAKDTSLDYGSRGRTGAALCRAARARPLRPESEIVVRTPGAGQSPPAAKRSRFGAGLKLDARPHVPTRALAPELSVPHGGGGAEHRLHAGRSIDGTGAPAKGQAGAAGRWLCTGLGRCRADAGGGWLPVLPHQAQALQAADRALEAFGARHGPGRAGGAGGRAAADAPDRRAKDGPEGARRGGHGYTARPTGWRWNERVHEVVLGWEHTGARARPGLPDGRYNWEYEARTVTQQRGGVCTGAEAGAASRGRAAAAGARGVRGGWGLQLRLEQVVQAPEVTERLMRQVGLEQARGRDHGPSLGL